MQKFNTLQDAIALAEFAHRNQIDKAGMPYIQHPKRVLAKVQAQGARPYVQAAAVLHDVTEDTTFTSGILLELGFSPAVVGLVDILDRKLSAIWHEEWQSPVDKDVFYYNTIRSNADALMIKLADINDNLEKWRLSYLPATEQTRLEAKYAKALAILMPL